MARESSSEAVLSVVSGPQNTPLWNKTLGSLIAEQSQQYGDRIAVSFPWQKVRKTYRQLAYRSQVVASSLIQAGLQPGDSIGVMAGNCYQYIEMVLGGGRIGCPIVVLNNTYSPQELRQAIVTSQCKMLCLADSIGKKSLADHLRIIQNSDTTVEKIIMFSDRTASSNTSKVLSYDDFVSRGLTAANNDPVLRQREASVLPTDLLNMQFTSGTTGSPKAAMLTHINLINNGRLVGDRLMLTHEDVLCCPPPLFHCFGLVMGFLGAFTHGSTIVFPADQFDPDRVLDALFAEKCTVLYGVPTMFVAELEAYKNKPYKITTVRTGLAAGAPVPMALMQQLKAQMGITTVLNAYGMTETSPVTFMTSLDDSYRCRLETIGKVMPHTRAKIIDRNGRIVPRGTRGEICTSGYALQRGYWQNKTKTEEVMRYDEDGVLWMHTGDEGMIDDEGYCAITGRIKDIIIRGGENIFPAEIEERLLEHPCVIEASVVGMPDDVYGEVVSCFLRQDADRERPKSAEISDWVRQAMGKHKAPRYVWWVGDQADVLEYPKTGSGKYQKHILREMGQSLMKKTRTLSKL